MCSLKRKPLFDEISIGAGLAPALQYESDAPSLSLTYNM